MARRSDHSREELKEMAVAAAERMIAADGVAGVSARKVATEIGYTPGTLYLIFRNLDELIIEVNGRTLAQLESKIKAVLTGSAQPVATIHSIAAIYLDYARQNRERWRAIFEHKVAEGEVPEFYQSQVDRLFALVEAPLRQIRGGTMADVEIAKEARALWAGVHGLTTLTVSEKLNTAGVNTDEILDLLVDRILGVETNSGGEL